MIAKLEMGILSGCQEVQEFTPYLYFSLDVCVEAMYTGGIDNITQKAYRIRFRRCNMINRDVCIYKFEAIV